MRSNKKKKLLIIGATSYFIDVINQAHELGMAVVMTDYNSQAYAKKYADIAYDCDTTDLEGVLKIAEKENIDGVFVGWSDINLYTALYICDQLRLPFYAKKNQLDCSVYKDNFKNMCIRNGVPTTKMYYTGNHMQDEIIDSINYPVIVKPVDNAGTRGISICNSKDELLIGLANALLYSKCKRFIVEEYIENKGFTFSAKYIIRNGEARLLCVGNRRVLGDGDIKALITSATAYPAPYTQQYIDTVDLSVRQMLKNEGFMNGQLFMEGIYTGKEFKFYEMGYRLSGGITYHITDYLTGINGMKMLINFSMTGEMCSEDEFQKIDPFLKGGLACSFAVLLREGTVERIDGMDLIKRTEGVIDVTQYYRLGQTVEKKDIGNVGQMFARFTVVGTTRERVLTLINTIEDNLRVIDNNGNDMFIRNEDAHRVLSNWCL